MITLGQMIMSLFTTGGRFNPMALLALGFTVALGYQHLTLRAENRELMRKADVVREASKDKTETLNEARNEQQEANEVIDNGGFDNDFLKRLQDLD